MKMRINRRSNKAIESSRLPYVLRTYSILDLSFPCLMSLSIDDIVHSTAYESVFVNSKISHVQILAIFNIQFARRYEQLMVSLILPTGY